MARKTRSWEKGTFTNATNAVGRDGKAIMSRSFSKPKAAPAAAKTSTPRRSKSATPKAKGPVGFHVGQGRPTVVGSLPGKAKSKAWYAAPKAKGSHVGQGRPTVVGSLSGKAGPKQPKAPSSGSTPSVSRSQSGNKRTAMVNAMSTEKLKAPKREKRPKYQRSLGSRR